MPSGAGQERKSKGLCPMEPHLGRRPQTPFNWVWGGRGISAPQGAEMPLPPQTQTNGGPGPQAPAGRHAEGVHSHDARALAFLLPGNDR